MIDKIRNLLLNQKLYKLKRKIAVNNLKTAKTAGIIYDATFPENEQLIKELYKFLEAENIQTESIGLYNSKNNENMPMHTIQHFYISRKDVNVFKVPKSEIAKNFMRKEFDILIDCNLNKHFTLKYISSLSMAHFKVGPSGGYHQNICDLIIDIKEALSLENFIEQAKHYLKIINNN